MENEFEIDDISRKGIIKKEKLNKMKQAIWNNKVLAESNTTKVVEGNYYFPPTSINKEFFKEISNKSTCPWKGIASYYDIIVEDNTNFGAAWCYKQSKDKAKEIKGYFAFWKGVEIK